MTYHFPLPTSWQVEPYDTHYSFAYVSECGQRKDFDFRVEFTEGVRRPEQLAVIALIEAAPRLLLEVQKLWMTECALEPESRHLGTEQLEELTALIAAATGRAA